MKVRKEQRKYQPKQQKTVAKMTRAFEVSFSRRNRTGKFILNPGTAHMRYVEQGINTGILVCFAGLYFFLLKLGIAAHRLPIPLPQSLSSLLQKNQVHSKPSKLNIMVWTVEYTRLVFEKIHCLKNSMDHFCFFFINKHFYECILFNQLTPTQITHFVNKNTLN